MTASTTKLGCFVKLRIEFPETYAINENHGERFKSGLPILVASLLHAAVTTSRQSGGVGFDRELNRCISQQKKPRTIPGPSVAEEVRRIRSQPRQRGCCRFTALRYPAKTRNRRPSNR